jgi:putative peptide zinc metalloprotease protein
MYTLTPAIPLPPLRQDLQLAEGGAASDGSKRWTLYDPLRHRYFVVSDSDVKMLSLWDCGSVEALQRLMAQARLPLDEANLSSLITFLSDNHLVRPTGPEATQQLLRQTLQIQATGWRWWLQRYMGLRVPLWRPQHFLQATLPIARSLVHRSGLLIWAMVTLLGLYLTGRQWDVFLGTFAEFLSPGGLLAYGLALVGLKLVHELGHAYAATHFGCKVNSMGVAVMMMVPMLYTDTSDAARLREKRQRMWIDAGGVLAESLVAGLATFMWAILPDGSARSIAFVLATSSWLMSLLVNLNPLSRFDGYYFLSDSLGIDNLQTRALAYTKWALGRALLGPIEAPPETLRPAQARGFVLYGVLVCWYRLGLYLAAAYLVYSYCFKALGLALFMVEMWAFVAQPIWRQTQHWWSLRQNVAGAQRGVLLAILVGLVLLFIAPLDRQVNLPAVLTWQDDTPLHAPEAAQVLEVNIRAGQHVKQGDLLLRLASPELLVKQATAQLNALSNNEKLDRISADAVDRDDALVLDRERVQNAEEIDGLNKREDQLEIRATRDGVIADVPEHLHVGQWVSPTQLLGRVLHGQQLDVRGFVDERDAPRLHTGANARFVPEDATRRSLPLHLALVEPTAAETISPAVLASVHGGRIAVTERKPGQLVPVVAQHRVVLTPDEAISPTTDIPQMLRGEVTVSAESESLMARTCRHVWRVFMAELRA